MRCVVSYSVSTSNHNGYLQKLLLKQVVSYSVSTSNHNRRSDLSVCRWVVSYSVSTSNHNCSLVFLFSVFVVSYSVSTSNHNYIYCGNFIDTLYLILFLHQTTTLSVETCMLNSCILFCFYIKPQRTAIDALKNSVLQLFLIFKNILTTVTKSI